MEENSINKSEGVEKENTQKVLLMRIGFFSFLLIVIVGFYVIASKELNHAHPHGSVEKKSQGYPGKNTVAILKNDPTAGVAINRAVTNNSQAAFATLDELAKKESDKEKAEVLALYAASSLINLDRKAGVEYYSKIANDITNSNLNRAYAMTQISQYAAGDANPEFLKVFFSDPSVYIKMSQNESKLFINKKILELYPMNIALSNVARLELKKSPSKENAKKLYDTYIPQIASTTLYFDGAEGLSHFSPQALLGTSYFLRDVEVYGVSSTTEVRAYFDQAYVSSLRHNQTITKQFILLGYADYLLSKKLNKDAVTVLVQLDREALTPMVSGNLKTTKGSEYPNLLSFTKTSANSTTTAEFIKKWNLLVK